MTIQRKFILAILFTVVVPTALFTIASVWYAHGQLSQFIYDRVTSVNTLKARQVKDHLADYRQNVLSLSQNQAVRDVFAAIAKSEKPSAAFDGLMADMRRDHDLDDIKLLTSDNKVVYVSRPKYNSQIGKVAEGLLLDSAHAGTSGISFSRPFRDITGDDLDDATFEMYISAPVKDKDNQILGILVVEADLDELYKVITDVSGLSSTGETVLAANDSYSALILTPLKYDPEAALTLHIPFGDSNGIGIQQAVQGESGYGDVIDYRGVSAMAAWQSLPDVNWGVITKIDTAEAMYVITNLKKFTMVGAVVWLMIVFTVFLIISRAILTKPIRHLTDVAQQLANGEGADKVDHSLLYRSDEIGKIATALHNLRQSQQHGPLESSKNIKLAPSQPDRYQGERLRD